MPVCAVPTCSTTHRTKDKSVTLYKFPKDNNYARIWVRNCMKKESFNTNSAFICSLHFSDEAYQRDINHDLLGFSSNKSLRKDAVPTLQLPSLGMLRKNSVEIFKTENVGSYYKAEKGKYPEECISLLVDLMPGLSPKSFLATKMSSDVFSGFRKNKCRTKFHFLNLKCPEKSLSVLKSQEPTVTESTIADAVPEENYKSSYLTQTENQEPSH